MMFLCGKIVSAKLSHTSLQSKLDYVQKAAQKNGKIVSAKLSHASLQSKLDYVQKAAQKNGKIVSAYNVYDMGEEDIHLAYFPMFINIENAGCLIVGGGQVALRKVKVLLDFGAKVYVVSDVICGDIKLMSGETGNIYLCERKLCDEDFENKSLVVAATDDKNVNRKIAQRAKQLNIYVNAVDSIEDCTFIFPSYQREKDVVAAYSSGGNSPVITQYLRDKGKHTLTELVGDMAEFMGNIRPYVKEHTESEVVRKSIYREIFELGIEMGRIPEEDEVEDIIKRISNGK